MAFSLSIRSDKGASVSIDGERALLLKLSRLDRAVGTAIATDAVRVGANMLVAPMRDAAPVGKTGNLQKSIGVKVHSKAGFAISLTGPRFGAHAHLVTQGTKDRFTKDGIFRGRMKPNPFIARTYQANADPVQNAMIRVIQRGVDREAAR